MQQKINILLPLILLVSGLYAQDKSSLVLSKDLESFNMGSTSLLSYENGVRASRSFSATFSNIKMTTTFYDLINKDYGDQRFSKTLESGTLTRFSWQDSRGNMWISGIDFYDTHQNIEAFSAYDTMKRFRHLSTNAFYGYQRNLGSDMKFSIYSGFSSCHYLDNRSTSFLPLGGFSLSKNYERGMVQLDIYKRAENTGDSSGIYGSQARREVKLSASLQLSKNLQLLGHCVVSAADTNFDEKNTTKKSHMVTANVEMNYQLSGAVSARANLTHRTYLNDQSIQRSPAGVQGSLSVNYAAF